MQNYADGFKKMVMDQNLLLQLIERVGDKTDYSMAPQGLRVYWNTLCSYQGWKLQKNYYFDHCRIVDENNIRLAWGKESDMISALEILAVS